MAPWVTRAVLVASIVTWLAVPGTSAADHIDISGSVAAAAEKVEATLVTIKVSWNFECRVTSSEGASWSGGLNLVENETGKETYVGGVTSASGDSSTSQSRTDQDRFVHAVGKVNCGERNSPYHGSDTKEFVSGDVLIPAKAPGGGGGGGGGGSGGGPTDPLAAGGCAVEVLGTPQNDTLVGTDANELIFSLGGDDSVTGGDGHDCLIGDSGNDRLNGGSGSDRLTGGSGNDLLVGGPGKNDYDAGPGNDRVKSKNGKKETVDCGPGKDKARVDKSDRLSGCEKVSGG
ncbi:MAG: calcium-binding protein [Actinomycetota bacterium]